jgi:sec-independent protein translocase protein TatA
MLGLGEIAILGGIVILVFGASRIPKIGRSIGESIKEFKKGLNSEEQDDTEEEKGTKSEDNPPKSE